MPFPMRNAPVFETTYRSDRRKHNHRCRCCWRVLRPGDEIVMMRRFFGKTWVIHRACGTQKHSTGFTWREIFDHWSKEAA